jgi:hypothetical protein
VLDVGTPGQPREVAALRDGATVAEWMGFQDGLAFLSTGSRDELRVVDARTPTAPRLRGRLQAAIDGPPLPAGEHVLLRRGNAVEVVALHDLDKPVSLGERNLAAGVPWQVNAMALQGQTLAVADYGRGIHLLGLQDGVLGPELALVPNPGVLGVAFMDAGTGRAYLLWLDGDGLTVADTSDPRAPNVVGRLFFPVNTGTNVTFGRGIAVAGGYAWVANGSRGLVVVDLADPTLPRLSGQPIFPGEPQPDYAYGVAISGTTAFAFGSKPRLYPFDIRDPARPHEFPWVELPQPPSAVLAHDGYAYVAARIAGEASLAVVDVRAPNVPKVMGELRLPWSTDLVQFVAPPGLMVSDRLVYLVGQSLLPVDVTDPNRLLPLSPIVVPHLPRSLVIHPPPPAIASGNMLVFADDGDAGVTVMRRRGVGIATASPSPTIPGTPGTTAVPTRTPPPIATATEPPTATAPAGRLWLPQLWNEPVRQRWPVLAEATRAGVIGMTTGPVSVTTNAALPLANRQLRSRHLTGGR